MRSRAILPAVVVVMAALAVPGAAAPPSGPALAALDADVERARREFEIPGVALAVVKDGRVVIAKGYGVKRLGASGSRGRRHPLRHRLEHEGLHRGRPGPARRRRQALLGRPRDPAPSVVPDVRPLRIAGDDDPRPADPPQRPGARRGRPPLLPAVHLHAEGNRGEGPVPEARLELPQRVRLRQHPLHRRGRGGGGGERQELGGIRPRPAAVAPAHGGYRPHRLVGARRSERRRCPCAGGRGRAHRRSGQCRQHRRRRRHPLERPRHGALGVRAARGAARPGAGAGAAGAHAPARPGAVVRADGDAHRGRPAVPGRPQPAFPRLRARLRRPRLPRAEGRGPHRRAVRDGLARGPRPGGEPRRRRA